MRQYPDGAPKAEEIPHIHREHGRERHDPYYWLNQRENPQVRHYLEAENAFLQRSLAPWDTLRQELFQEMKARLKPTDLSVPYLLRGYWYYVRHEEGKEYPIYCRKVDLAKGEEEILLDVNLEATGNSFFEETGLTVSPDNQWLAVGIDTIGRRNYQLKVRNISTGEWLPFAEEHTDGSYAWASDNRHLFFDRKDPNTLRTHQIWRCTPHAENPAVLVFEEYDEAFQVGLSKTKDQAFVMLLSQSTLQTEIHTIPSNEPKASPSLLFQRQGEHLYFAEHFKGNFYLLSNWNAKNFQLVTFPAGPCHPESWNVLVSHREDVLLEGMQLFDLGLVLEERQKAQNSFRFIPWEGKPEINLKLNDPTGTCWQDYNPDLGQHWFRFGFTSLTQAHSVMEWNLSTGEQKLLKKQEVLGNYQESDYASERLWANARDGSMIPISLVYKKSLKNPQGNHLLLYGYGSYGISLDPTFSASRLSLLDRGWVFAIAHVRGGQEMGRLWYEHGRQGQKMNSFLDFIDAAEWLREKKYAGPNQLHAMGGSAGGLLVAAVMNMRPDLFWSVVAQVPFVDVLTTMLDKSIPLTTGEFDEWGNPENQAAYACMEAYSPYDGVKEQDYPHVLATAGFHDSQVQYWEPAKWVARLRAKRSSDAKCLFLHTDLESGHGGKTGRFKRLEEVALMFTFLLACSMKPLAAPQGELEPG